MYNEWKAVQNVKEENSFIPWQFTLNVSQLMLGKTVWELLETFSDNTEQVGPVIWLTVEHIGMFVWAQAYKSLWGFRF